MFDAKLLLTLALVSLVSLSGCLDGDEPAAAGAQVVEAETYELATGKGAIMGVLIDDRFRPIPGGLVLLEETADTVTTTENGEFQFLDLEPGQYTLRVDARGHEASPTTVAVEEGLFAEANVVARRLAADGNTILTEEYSAFVPCQQSYPTSTGTHCSLAFYDGSGDTNRIGFELDYRELGGNVTYMVVEMLSNKEASTDGALKLVVRKQNPASEYYINGIITEGSYLKTWTQYGEVSPHDLEDRNHEWLNDQKFDVQVWAQGQFKEETQQVFDSPVTDLTCSTAGSYCNVDSRGVGAQMGVKVQFVLSLFLGDPDVDIDSYCTLC